MPLPLKDHYVVRDFPRHVRDRLDNEYDITVHRCRRPTWETYRVCIHGPQFTTIVSDFDVHVGRYESERDELLVSLSAVGYACAVALRLSQLLPWQLLSHAQCVDSRLQKGLANGQETKETRSRLPTG